MERTELDTSQFESLFFPSLVVRPGTNFLAFQKLKFLYLHMHLDKSVIKKES